MRDDLDKDWFSLAKFKNIIQKEFGMTGGQIRLEANPPQEGVPEYIVIDGTDDEYYGTDDEKFAEMMKQFLYESQNLKATRFVLELVNFRNA